MKETTMQPGWTLDDIDWKAFDPEKVNLETLQAVKAAAMVEFNAHDYVLYLCNVFSGHPDIQTLIKKWGAEEEQHGRALARWAGLADPGFDFDKTFHRFRQIYGIDTGTAQSIRGSRTGEMVARCVVESGTSSFYTAIKDSTSEPVLKNIAARIAADEFRHYKLFLNMSRHFKNEAPSLLTRIRIAIGRVQEADDDELASAFYAANAPVDGSIPYNRKRFSAAYEARVLRLYKRRHADRLVSMIANAAGIAPRGHIVRFLSPLVWKIWNWRLRRANALAVQMERPILSTTGRNALTTFS